MVLATIAGIVISLGMGAAAIGFMLHHMTVASGSQDAVRHSVTQQRLLPAKPRKSCLSLFLTFEAFFRPKSYEFRIRMRNFAPKFDSTKSILRLTDISTEL